MTEVTVGFLAGIDLQGADVIRAELALLIAAELDDEATPKHSIPRLSGQLRALLTELEMSPRANGRWAAGSVDALLADVGR